MVLGLAVGAASAVVPMYIAEHTPPRIRGGTVSYHQLMITVGILFFAARVPETGGRSLEEIERELVV